MKCKIPKNLNINKWLAKLEFHARYFMWVFGAVLAFATIASIWILLTNTFRLILSVFLILFIFAGLVVFIRDIQRSSQQKDAKIPADVEQPSRNKWISIGLLILIAVVLVLIFVARQLPATPQGYQIFFTAFAAIGAWVTGIAIAVFAYQQYKLRQTEHRLLFEPQVLLVSTEAPKTGAAKYSNLKYPYCIEWAVSVLNPSQLPIVVNHIEMLIRLARENNGRQVPLTPLYCHVLEPKDLNFPFPLTSSTPQIIRWIVEGPNVSDAFEYVSGESNKRDFELICKVFATVPQEPEKIILRETISQAFFVPRNATWGIFTPFIE